MLGDLFDSVWALNASATPMPASSSHRETKNLSYLQGLASGLRTYLLNILITFTNLSVSYIQLASVYFSAYIHILSTLPDYELNKYVNKKVASWGVNHH